MTDRDTLGDDTCSFLADTLDGLTEGLVIYDANERLLLCNHEFRHQLAPISDKLVPGTPWRDILRTCIDAGLAIGISDMDGDLDAQCDALRSMKDRQSSLRELNGRFYDLSYNPMGNGGFFITRADITERVAAENRLKERGELIRLVIEACPAPILMNRADTGEILFISPQAKELYGNRPSSRDYYVTLDDRTKFVGAVRRHGEVQDYRLRLKNAHGEPFWSAVSARLIQWGGQDVIVSHTRDMTGQLAMEEQLARQREQVFRTEKMSALGGLLAGVAHELNNPLSVVVGHAMMLSDEADDPNVLRQIKKIGTAAERCSKIVRTFLSMARQDPVRMETIEMSDLLDAAANAGRLGDQDRAITIETLCDENLPQMIGNRDQITQAILNLIFNAEQAIKESGTGDRIAISAHLIRAKDQIKVTVEDNGPGIPADIRARVFEPFFSTKGVGGGTGIGLAVSHRIIAAHNGELEVENVDPHGACFTITMPLGTLKQPSQNTETPMPKKSKSIRVLVIDDEVDVADLNVEVLQRGGYEADAVHHAENALDMLRTGHYDVVLSDLNMPGLDGRGVFEAISQEFPELVSRTGFVTGDTMGRASQAFLKESRRPYIEKPVSPKELSDFVAQLGTVGDSQ